jgi:hypothetical protein
MPALRSRPWVVVSPFAIVACAAAIVSTPLPAQPPTPPPKTQPTQPFVSPSLQTQLTTDSSTSVFTETIGLLAGLQLYQTYLNIGLLADAKAEGIYEATEVKQLLGSVVTPLDQVDKQLEKVAAVKGLSKDDVAAITKMRKIIGLLKTQGKSLQAFWDTGAEENGKKYETARQAAWKALADLLELEPRKEANPEPKPAEKKP